MRSTFAVFALLLLTATATAQSPQPLDITITPPAALGTDDRGQWRITVRNLTDSAIGDAVLSFSVFQAQFVQMMPQLVCSTVPAGPTVALNRCALPPIGPRGTFDVYVTLHTGVRYGTVGTVASIERPGNDRLDRSLVTTFWKDYMVTSTADSGPGTLRQAILDINRECQAPVGTIPTPCRAAFNITAKIGGDFFHTVELQSPLPPLDVPISSVDGTTEDQSNTLGPSVALDGAMLHEGNGITVDSGTCDVKGIAIGSFPWNGIHARNRARVNVDRVYIGVNALGMVPRPNGSRGIASESVAGTITNSFIAYNRRSGIFFAGPFSAGTDVRGNRIFANGASGIYVGPYNRVNNFTFIRDNVISHNAHFGIAIDPAALVIVEPNSIFSNGGSGIDIGLNGPTGGIEGIPGRGGIYPPPLITSARYENGFTVITGTVQRTNLTSSTSIYLYANDELELDGFAEGKQYLAEVRADSGTFTVSLPIDLRGKYVNGVTRRNQAVPYDDAGETATSELGRAIRVE